MLQGRYQEAIGVYLKQLEDVDDLKAMQEIYGKISRCHSEMGEFDEALKYINDGLSLSTEPSPSKLHLLSEKMWIFIKTGKLEEAEKVISLMEREVKKLDDENLVRVMEDKATLLYYKGLYHEAERYLKKIMELRRNQGDEQHLSTLFTNMGIIIAQTGNIKKAVNFFKISREIDEKYGNIRGLALDYSNLGIAYHRMGKLRRAISFFKKAQDIKRRIGSRDSLGIGYLNIGNILMDMGEFDKAIDSIEKSQKIFREIGDTWGLCYGYYSMGEVMRYIGMYEKAINWLNKSIELSKSTRNMGCMIESYMSLIGIYVDMDRRDLIIQNFRKLISAMRGVNDIVLIAKMKYINGVILAHFGDYRDAHRMFECSEEKFKRIGDRINMAIVSCSEGMNMLRLGEEREGKDKIKKAMRIFERENMKYWIKKCKNMNL